MLEDVLGNSLSHKVKNLGLDYIPSKHILVKDMVLKIVQNDGKVILWGIFIDSIKRLHKYLQSCGLKGAYVIGETKKSSKEDGDQNDVTRENIIHKFKFSDLDYIISNPVVLGESISLHKVCHNAIYFEQWYAAAPYVQSRDRIHRVWLDENNKQRNYETNYYNVVSRLSSNASTVDDKIFNNVNKKMKRMLNIINDDIPLFSYNLENERDLLIKEIVNEYRR